MRNRGARVRRRPGRRHAPANGPRSIASDGRSPRRPTRPHRRRTDAGPRRVVAGVEQLPWRRLTNPFRPLEILSEDQVEAIHRASLRILAEIGFEVLGDRALDAFAGAGARVDRSSAQRPPRSRPGRGARSRPRRREFTLHARNPERNVVFGGGTPRLLRGRRAGLRHRPRSRPAAPATSPTSSTTCGSSARSTSSTRRAAARSSRPTCRSRPATSTCTGRSPPSSTRPGSASASGRRPSTTRWRSPRSSAASTATRSSDEPSCMTIINTNSPLRLDGPMGDGLIEMAKHGQPVVATPFTLAGRDEPGLARRRDRPAERRGAVPGRAGPDRPARARRWSTARSPRTSTCAPAHRRSGRRSREVPVRERPDGAPLRAAVAVVERDGVERRRRPGRLRGRDGRLGRGDGRRQPALPGRRLARGRADRVVREAHRRRRDPPDDVGGAPAAPRRRGQPRLRRDRRGRAGRALLRHRPHARALRDTPSTGR